MDSISENERKCSRITKNPFFNFLRCFRALPQNQFKPASKLARDGAKVWKRLAEDEREEYRKMAEPFLKHPRSRSGTPSGQPGTDTRRRKRRSGQRKARSPCRRTRRTVNQIRTRKSRSRAIKRRTVRTRPRTHNSRSRKLNRRRPRTARPKNLCAPLQVPTIRVSQKTPDADNHPALHSCLKPPARTLSEPLLNSPSTTSFQKSDCNPSCHVTTTKPESQSQDSREKVSQSSCEDRNSDGVQVNKAPFASDKSQTDMNVDCCRVIMKSKDESEKPMD